MQSQAKRPQRINTRHLGKAAYTDGMGPHYVYRRAPDDTSKLAKTRAYWGDSRNRDYNRDCDACWFGYAHSVEYHDQFSGPLDACLVEPDFRAERQRRAG